MKTVLLGLAAAAAIALLAGNANAAADGSKLIAACKVNLTNKTLPPGIPEGSYLKFCECLVTKAGDNQAEIDEHTGIATAKGADVQAKINAASQGAKDHAAACQTDLGIAPPAPPK